jgi:hypothetical protein
VTTTAALDALTVCLFRRRVLDRHFAGAQWSVPSFVAVCGEALALTSAGDTLPPRRAIGRGQYVTTHRKGGQK